MCPPQRYTRTWLNKPLLLALVNGLCEGGVIHNDGCIGAVGGLRPFGFVGVVGALVTEQMTDQEHQRAEDGKNHNCDDACWRSENEECFKIHDV